VAREQVISPEMAKSLCELSFELNRQIGVLLHRSGKVEQLVVGDFKGIMIPRLGAVRGTGGRLKGLRLVHTHLAGEAISDEDLMDLLFLRLDLLSILTITGDGLPERLSSAHLLPHPVDGKSWAFLEPRHPAAQKESFADFIDDLEDGFARRQSTSQVDKGQDRAILISVSMDGQLRAEESLAELAELTRSDNIQVLETVLQRSRKVNPRLILGKGKLAEVMILALQLDANLLIFNQELNPSQLRSITDHTEMRVIDRTQLILDIFAHRALSREGRLQVEMAQLKYMLPRLSTRDDALSRLSGGIGTRGPGETKLETHRRRIDDRLARLTKELEQVGKERYQRRAMRRKKELPVLSLVGYTNAGKSTLLNTLTHSNITAEDKLFATLDPTSRRLRFPHEMEVVVTDTVGFIRHLPAELLKAFAATLEELQEADLLVHVIDLSNPAFREQIQVVEDLLRELELDEIPCLKVFNKMDREGVGEQLLACARQEGVIISALDAMTFTPFLERAEQLMGKILKEFEMGRS
jgi:GTPase